MEQIGRKRVSLWETSTTMTPHFLTQRVCIAFVRKASFFVVLMTLFTLAGTAQNKKVIDSLQAALETTNDKKLQVELYNELANQYIPVDSTKVMEYCGKALQLSEELGYDKGVTTAWYYMGTAHWIRGNYEPGAKYLKRSKQRADATGLLRASGSATMSLGTIFSMKGNFDSARFYLKESFRIFTELDDENSLSKSYLELGVVEYKMANFPAAIENIEKALSIALKYDDKRVILASYGNMGSIYRQSGDHANSLESYLKTAAIAQEIGMTNSVALSYQHIGNLYKLQADYDQAIEYMAKAEATYEEAGNMTNVASMRVTLGSVYLTKGAIEEAEAFFLKALETARENKSNEKMANALQMLGQTEMVKNNLTPALEYLNEARDILVQIDKKDNLSSTLIDIGEIYLRRGQYQTARRNIKEGLALATEIGYPSGARKGNEQLYKAEEALGNHRQALDAFVKFKELSDSLKNDDITKKITRLEAEYEFQQERDSVAFEQQKATLAYEEKLSRNRLLTQGAVGGGALAVVILVLLYRSYLIKQKSNQELRHKNEVIALKNDELVTKNGEISELRETEKKMAEETLALKERELTTVTMLSHEKNSLLEQLGTQISDLSHKVNDDVIPDLKEIKRTIRTNLSQESWSMFMYQFEKVHPAFFSMLKERFPVITQHDLRLSAYLKVGMDNKEIARVSNITIEGVKKSINRLKKKMNLGPEEDLRDFLIKL